MDYFINKYMNQLELINNKLQNYPEMGSNPNPDKTGVDHLMLLEEKKKLEDRINREAKAQGVKNPLQQQKHSPNNNTNFQQSSYVDNSQTNIDTPDSKVSPEERRKACEKLKPNGCGPAGLMGNFVRNDPGGFDFTEICNNHDRRYATLGFEKDKADRLMLDEGAELVLAQTSPEDRRRRVGISEINKYYQMVRQYGKKSYDDAQRNAYICKYGKKP